MSTTLRNHSVRLTISAGANPVGIDLICRRLVSSPGDEVVRATFGDRTLCRYPDESEDAFLEHVRLEVLANSSRRPCRSILWPEAKA